MAAQLPAVPRRLVTTETPRNRVTAADAAGPFRMLADALGSFAPGVRALEQEAGKNAGLQAVTTGEDGLPRVETMPVLSGDYGAGYNRAARWKYLAELAPAVENAIHKARLDFANNPADFEQWIKGYRNELSRRERDPQLRAAVEKMIDTEGGQAFRAVSTEHFRQQVTGAKTALDARRAQIENKLAALARDGGTGSPEYREAVSDYDAIGEEYVANPLFGESRAEIVRKRERMLARHNALATVGMVARVAADKSVDDEGNPLGGPRRAKALADNILTDPEIDLTEEERRGYHRQAIAEIRALSAENRALVSQLNVESREWVRAVESGEVNPADIDDFLDRAAEAGAVRAVERVTKAAAVQSYLRGSFERLSLGERARAVIELQGRGGGDREVAAIIGAESGGDPTARAATSSAAGLGQFVAGTWLDLIRRHAPEVAAGRSEQEILALRTDPNFADLNRRMVGVYRDENRAALQQAGVASDSGAVYLAHFLGAGDAIKVLQASPDTPLVGLVQQRSIDANRTIFARNPTAKDIIAFARRKVGDVVPAGARGDPAFLNAVRKHAASDLNRVLPQIEARVKAGETVDAQELDDLGALVYAVGGEDERRRVVQMAVLASVGEQLAGMSAQEREAAGIEFARRFAQGSTQLESEIGSYVGTYSKKIADAYKNDPYDAAVRYGGRPATPPVDFAGDPAALDAAIQAREAERIFIREREGIDPGTLLRPREAQALKGALLGSEPARIAAAAAIASNLLASNPNAFAGLAGENEVVKEALKFRHYVDDLAMPAGQAAARLLLERTPEHKARVAAQVKGEDIDKIVKDKVALSDLEKAFDASWWPGRPAVGFTPEQRIGMYGDYVELFRERYAETGDAETAKKLAQDQLKRVWGVTGVSGTDIVMRYPPEKIPALQGIENAAEVVATQAIEAIRAETGETVERGNLRLTVIPGHTAAAFRNGKAVPYMLGWVDAQGIPHWLPPGRAFVVDADAARQAQSERREAAFRREQEISRLDPAGRIGARLGIPRIFGE